MSIFKEYDIRGVYPDELDEKVAYKIGCAIADFLKEKSIIVGRDMRLSSDLLFAAIAEALTNKGIDVIDIGVCSTPMLYFASGSLNKAAIMITASHNPPEYNGIKVCRKGSVPVSYSTGISRIEAMSAKVTEKPRLIRKGKVKQMDVLDGYIGHVLKFSGKISKLKIVADAGNGMAGLIAPLVLKRFDVKLIPMYFEIDGSFPHHVPNPMIPENLKALRGRVKKEKADLGIAFDGDADRVVFVDEKGNSIGGDMITGLLAHEVLAKESGQTIVYDLRSSKAIPEEIEALGGKAIMVRVGHSLAKAVMRKEKAVLGGELSAHYYFKDNYYSDCAIITMLKILTLVCSKRKRLSQLVKPLQKYYQTGELNFKVEDKDRKIAEVEKHFKDAKKIMHLDGLSVYYNNWWFNLRKSNTEPFLRLNLEADTKRVMEEKRKYLTNLIKR